MSGCNQQRRTTARVVAVSLGWASTMAACETGPQFSSSISRMATVALTTEDTLVVSAPVDVDIRGGVRVSELQVTLDLTVTASSADVAEREAERVEIAVSRRDGEVILGIGGIDGGVVQGVSGSYVLTGPADLNARVVGGGSSVAVDGLDGRIDIEAAGDVRVIDAQSDLVARVGNGNAIIDTRATVGSLTDITVQTGSIDLRLPAPLSARVAAAAEGGSLVVDHPELPAPIAGLAYDVVVGAGLAGVAAVTRSGNIVVRRR